MGIAFLRLEQAKAKWRIKLVHAFERRTTPGQRGGAVSRWALFFLPFITVLREGLEAVVFTGGVSVICVPGDLCSHCIAGIFVAVRFIHSPCRHCGYHCRSRCLWVTPFPPHTRRAILAAPLIPSC